MNWFSHQSDRNKWRSADSVHTRVDSWISYFTDALTLKHILTSEKLMLYLWCLHWRTALLSGRHYWCSVVWCECVIEQQTCHDDVHLLKKMFYMLCDVTLDRLLVTLWIHRLFDCFVKNVVAVSPEWHLFSHGSLVSLVPAGHQTLPPPRGPALPGQHLPGGRRADVVPVERAERVHRLHLELRTLPRQRLRPAQPAGTAG